MEKIITPINSSRILLKNYYKEKLITSRCHLFPSFYYPTSQIGINIIKRPNETKYNPNHFAQLNWYQKT